MTDLAEQKAILQTLTASVRADDIVEVVATEEAADMVAAQHYFDPMVWVFGEIEATFPALEQSKVIHAYLYAITDESNAGTLETIIENMRTAWLDVTNYDEDPITAVVIEQAEQIFETDGEQKLKYRFLLYW